MASAGIWAVCCCGQPAARCCGAVRVVHHSQRFHKAVSLAPALTHHFLRFRSADSDIVTLSRIASMVLPQLIKMGHMTEAAELGR